jgi:hypothetical protein
MSTPGNHRTRDILAAVGRAYPLAWQQADAFRAMRGTEGFIDWPDWCYLPLHGAYAIVSGGGDARVHYERSHHIGIVGALAQWRVTQGIYRVDPALYQALIDTPVEGDLPTACLYRLPEWCAYVETPGLLVGGVQTHGVWAHMDWSEGAPDELRLVLDQARDVRSPLDADTGLVPIPIILGEGGIAESLRRLIDSGKRKAREHGFGQLSEQAQALDQHPERELAPILSLLLYLCADDADLAGQRRQPRAKIDKHGRHRVYAPDAPQVWSVGVRLGAALRAAYHAAQTGQPTGGASSPRPHIRRAHWHGFWTGPKAGPRKLALRWLPPIAVRLDDAASLPAVVHPVKSDQLLQACEAGTTKRIGAK